MNNAPCANDPELFHAPDQESPASKTWREAEAKKICAGCPLREPCLAIAMDVEGDLSPANRNGLYGGLTEQERADLAKGVTPKEKPKPVCDECGQICASPKGLASHKRGHGPIKHGTEHGYKKHLQRGEPVCDECRTAQQNHYRTHRDKRKKAAA